jgi:polysaccharide biosynthesis protein PslJ
VKVLAGSAERGPVAPAMVVLGALGVLALTVVVDLQVRNVAAAVILMVAATVAYRSLLRWHVLLAIVIAVIMLIPIHRYELPGGLPFDLEPYRLLIAFVAIGWLVSLLVDPRVRLRASGLEPPLLLFLLAVLVSVTLNVGSDDLASGGELVKKLAFLTSFVIVYYIVVSVVRTSAQAQLLLKVLVACGAVAAFFAIIESRTSFNVFDHLARIVPLLDLVRLPDVPPRGERFRAYASAQHPIALSAVLVMLIPLAVALGRVSARRWWIAAALLVVGALGTVSRTGLLMLLVIALVFLWLRPIETRRILSVAIVPLLLFVHFALPNTLAPLTEAFFPSGGIIEQQRGAVGLPGQGRLADLELALEDLSKDPRMLGRGYGARTVVGEEEQILDNQWLAVLLQTGFVGTSALLWMFVRAVRRFARAAKHDDSPTGWLLVAVTASVAAYAVGMLVFDAFHFIQVTFVLFMLLAFGSVLVSSAPSGTGAGRSQRREAVAGSGPR